MLIIGAWEGRQADFDALHARVIANPFDVDTVVLCRRLALRSSDYLSPERAWSCEGAGKPDVALLVRIGPSRVTLALLPGADPGPHFGNVYRRNAPFDQLVPGIPHLSTLPV